MTRRYASAMRLAAMRSLRDGAGALRALVLPRWRGAGASAAPAAPPVPRATAPGAPWLSVIVPALNEASTISPLLSDVSLPGVETIVVDGGSSDGTASLARRQADVVLVTARGRATQMNAGAVAARGEVLLFVHADTRMPVGFDAEIAAALADPTVVGGRFDLRLDAPGPLYRLIGLLISARSRMTGVASGDQGIFVRREVFERLGGYPPVPLMEDLALSRALKRMGRTACLRATVTTSARRWQRHGPLRTILLMWSLRALYYCGVSPHVLRRAYPDCD